MVQALIGLSIFFGFWIGFWIIIYKIFGITFFDCVSFFTSIVIVVGFTKYFIESINDISEFNKLDLKRQAYGYGLLDNESRKKVDELINLNLELEALNLELKSFNLELESCDKNQSNSFEKRLRQGWLDHKISNLKTQIASLESEVKKSYEETITK